MGQRKKLFEYQARVKVVVFPIGTGSFWYAVLFSARARCALLRAAPLLRLVPAFLAGQSLGCAVPLPRPLLAGLVLLLVGFSCCRRKAARYALAGLCTTLPLYMSQGTFPAGESRFLIRVVGPPDYRRNEQITITADVLRVAEKRYHLLAGQRVRCRGPLLPWLNSAGLREGGMYAIQARIRPLPQSVYPFDFNSRLWRRRIAGFCNMRHVSEPLSNSSGLEPAMQQRIVTAVRSSLGDSEATSIVLSMTVGLVGALSLRTEAAFKELGLAHILVVSGYHFGVLVVTFVGATGALSRLFPPARRFAIRRYLILLMLVVLICYCFLIGGTQSGTRALVAIAAVVAAGFWERGTSFFNGILLALLLVSARWPGALFELGPQYTFAALAGIGLALAKRSGRVPIFFRVPLYATAATSIVTLLWFHTFSIWPFIVNCTLAPLAALVICKGGIGALCVFYCNETAGVIVLQCVRFGAGLLRDIVWLLADTSAAEQPHSPWIVAVYVLIISTAAAREARLACQSFLQWRGVFPYNSRYAMQRTRIDL